MHRIKPTVHAYIKLGLRSELSLAADQLDKWRSAGCWLVMADRYRIDHANYYAVDDYLACTYKQLFGRLLQ